MKEKSRRNASEAPPEAEASMPVPDAGKTQDASQQLLAAYDLRSIILGEALETIKLSGLGSWADIAAHLRNLADVIEVKASTLTEAEAVNRAAQCKMADHIAALIMLGQWPPDRKSAN
jgi:hypothetical protein